MKLSKLLNEDKDELLVKIKKIRDQYFSLASNERGPGNASTFGKFKIVGDKVDYLSEVLHLDWRFLENQELNIPFASAPTLVLLDSCMSTLKSFKNFPRVLTGAKNAQTFTTAYYHTGGADFITSYEGFPEIITGSVSLMNSKLMKISLSKINRHIKQLDGILLINREYEGPLLSTFLIDKLEKVATSNVQIDELMIKCFKMKDDIISVKELLMSEGYKEWAKL